MYHDLNGGFEEEVAYGLGERNELTDRGDDGFKKRKIAGVCIRGSCQTARLVLRLRALPFAVDAHLTDRDLLRRFVE